MAARNPDIAQIISTAVRGSRMTRREIASAIGISQATVSRWASGAASPASAYWPRIQSVLGVDLAQAGYVTPSPGDEQLAELRTLIESHWVVIQEQAEQLDALTARVTELDAALVQVKRGGRPAADGSR